MNLGAWLRRLERCVPTRAIDPARLAEELRMMDATIGGAPDLPPADVRAVYFDRPDIVTAGLRLGELAAKKTCGPEAGARAETEAGDARGKD